MDASIVYAQKSRASTELSNALPGDIVFVHSKGLVGWLIRFGQWLRHPRKTAFWSWNHCAIISDNFGPDRPYVIQAESAGVTDDKTLADIAPGGKFQVVALPAGVDRAKVLAFAKSKVGTEYGFIEDASLGLTMLSLGAIRVNINEDGTIICSALAALSMLAGGWMSVPVPNYYGFTPADMAQALGVGNSPIAYLARKGLPV